ncbi:histone deacetylase family protein [Desulfococcus multivorans]|jgi:acetoin utilization deacetylase AcuC-like enzyme|uniref:Histone deacetylase domain containing protein n=1 Tax=Desulfococcus multivorans DSM 2059 TaxID=1121405 RepID=S7T9S0_DESML|nr:histone deacetylase [Desulfococcus multivorans]AOY57322.1 HdaH: histone deacetylase-like amidohydrolase [Desulfococcus multivorans]AQU99773.1 histone deacetylase [Desulfococcus multivorans]EPR33275.1 Histone deacetylase domain containing protein [Desulfococcus multivorans DSM 2059]MDX9818951.1 histone deacetylase [Desulfococcus multivorans]SKA22040.1 Acetoin utilization deacetylase AcuC [Desulfococcus multivorans DSM 2059]
MLCAKHKTGLVFFPAFDWAISPNHPEREERLLYTQDQVLEEGLLDIDGIIEYKPDIATIRDIQRTHFCVPDEWEVTTESHFISAGGAKTIGMAVMDKQVERGFALVRPPGHHAMRVVHGSRGFCNINIEAMMIEYLRTAYKVGRVAIVDTDCHHGDGTQDIYWHDPDVLFISLHQDGRTLYPGSGFLNELGGPNAAGLTVNIPLPPNTSEEGFIYALEEMVLPILADFKPDIIINSAGQDNHYADPLTNMNFSAQGYARLTELLKPDIAVLEGGYSIESALPYMNVGIILAMAGLDYSRVREPDYDPDGIRQGREVTEYIRRLGDKVMTGWNRRDETRKELQAGKTFDQRRRSIFYDTDNILEKQEETVRICEECGGCWSIDTSSDGRKRALAVHLPIKGCAACRETAYQWYESADPKTFDLALLQDRQKDRYLKREL